MKKKFVVYPGYVISKVDEQEHFISAGRLIQLYRVNPAECIIVEYGRRLEGYRQEDLVSLYPDDSGQYII